jgi:hypothetical protein
VCEEERLRRKMVSLAMAVVYLLAFVVPPVLVGVVGTKAALSARYEAPPAVARDKAGDLPAPPRHDLDKPTAVRLLGLALAGLIGRLLGPATKRFRRSPKAKSA